ncbi:hypothetical protein ACE193_25325 (plasmid) [Bernardetia sp. OM2101]|uniref:hypothetical protein n=1 Tax=Bernardetia sp. OM2101 TaxID=3344876 RepID=UPI0035CFB465
MNKNSKNNQIISKQDFPDSFDYNEFSEQELKAIEELEAEFPVEYIEKMFDDAAKKRTKGKIRNMLRRRVAPKEYNETIIKINGVVFKVDKDNFVKRNKTIININVVNNDLIHPKSLINDIDNANSVVVIVRGQLNKLNDVEMTNEKDDVDSAYS